MITFGIPKREINKKTELFPNTPVVTMLPWEGKGFGKKFQFNNAALEELNVIPGVSRVLFAFDEEDSYIAKNTTEDSLLVGKNMAFSNKNFYDFLTKRHSLDNSIANHFELTGKVDIGGIDVYMLKTIIPTTVTIPITPEPSAVVAKEIEHMDEDMASEDESSMEHGGLEEVVHVEVEESTITDGSLRSW